MRTYTKSFFPDTLSSASISAFARLERKTCSQRCCFREASGTGTEEHAPGQFQHLSYVVDMRLWRFRRVKPTVVQSIAREDSSVDMRRWLPNQRQLKGRKHTITDQLTLKPSMAVFGYPP